MTPPKTTRIRFSEFLRYIGRYPTYTPEKILKMYPLIPRDAFIKEEYNVFVDTYILNNQNQILRKYLTKKNLRWHKKHQSPKDAKPDKVRLQKVLEANNIKTNYISDQAIKYCTNLPLEAIVKEGKKVFVLTNYLNKNLEIKKKYRRPALEELITLAGFEEDNLVLYADFLSANGLGRDYSKKDFYIAHPYYPSDFIVKIGTRNYVPKKYLDETLKSTIQKPVKKKSEKENQNEQNQNIIK
ncbi:MAG: hypothetical protein ACP5N3_01810 [Candidatus Nanoarchaeia archaeon]